MTQFISNPFQVLGVSDVDSQKPSVPIATSVETAVSGEFDRSASNATPKIIEAAQAAKAAGATPTGPHTSWLHNFGEFLLSDILPIVLQIGLPILERKI